MTEERPAGRGLWRHELGRDRAPYDDWAEGYDTEMAALGYRHPAICLALLARHLPAGAGPVLDAGAGTGLLGEWLHILGFRPLAAVDLSAGMLRVAEARVSTTCSNRAT